MFLRVLCCCMVIMLSPLSFAAQLQGMEVKDQDAKASVFFTIKGMVNPKVFRLAKPDRVVVDFAKTSLAFTPNPKPPQNSFIKAVRSGQPKKGDLRFVFELDQVLDFKTRLWRSGKGDIKGIFITFYKTKEYKKTEPVVVKEERLAKKEGFVRHSPARTLRDVVIVLDAGHGGKDPGARGPRGSLEKNVVLAIALKLKQLIDKQPGMRAVLTRKGDYYIGLRQRLDMARKYDGDVFVAIHADAFINHQSNGASVFALSQRGATSEAARWLAEKENYSELGGVNLADLDDYNGMVRTVLIDLSQTATINASLQMGKRVLSQLDGMTSLHNEQVEQARFVVLKSPDIPSILIETGFISNPREEKNLTSPWYQQRLSLAIFQGIKQYFWDYPPHGTRVESLSGVKSHMVKSGESLPEIAKNYHISLASLCAVNALAPDQPLQPGQKLVIPSSWA